MGDLLGNLGLRMRLPLLAALPRRKLKTFPESEELRDVFDCLKVTLLKVIPALIDLLNPSGFRECPISAI